MLPKPQTPRDPKYLAWIRTLPCLFCGKPGPSQAHHTATGGMSLKGSDFSCVPLCGDCHSIMHTEHGKRLTEDNSSMDQAIERLQEYYNTKIKGD